MTQPEVGKSETVLDGVRRVLAPNPSPMTHWGTNSFVLGEGRVAIVDPGPDDAAHHEALMRATAGEEISHILVTHAHGDHSPLARRIASETGAPILGFGPPDAGRSATMVRLHAAGLTGGGEGIDPDFLPDTTIAEGDEVTGDGWRVQVLHTPGHFAGHLAFQFNDAILSGDHVMDWSSSLVSPPDGDLAAFMATSHRLRDHGARLLLPGHGGGITDPADRLNWLIEHRTARENAILDALTRQPQPLQAITETVYRDIPQKMLPAAARNVFAHLIDLVDRNFAQADPELGVTAAFRRK